MIIVKNMNGYRLGTARININCYPDYAVSIVESQRVLQRLKFDFNKSCKLFNTKNSTTKTITVRAL